MGGEGAGGAAKGAKMRLSNHRVTQPTPRENCLKYRWAACETPRDKSSQVAQGRKAQKKTGQIREKTPVLT